MEATITHIWMRFNRRWVLAGATSGAFAGLVVLLVAVFLSVRVVGEWSQPMKLVGAMVFGENATAYGSLGWAGFVGLWIHLGFSALFGATFAQLVHEKSSSKAMLILGLVTSFIIWVFGCQLFGPAFNPTLKSFMPTGVGLFFHLFFGFTFGALIGKLRGYFLKSQDL